MKQMWSWTWTYVNHEAHGREDSYTYSLRGASLFIGEVISMALLRSRVKIPCFLYERSSLENFLERFMCKVTFEEPCIPKTKVWLRWGWRALILTIPWTEGIRWCKDWWALQLSFLLGLLMIFFYMVGKYRQEGVGFARSVGWFPIKE